MSGGDDAIVGYDDRYAAAFEALNTAWIERFFAMEAKDREVLGDPRGKIIAKGGQVFFALRDGVPAGCVALIPMADGGFELAKMAVDPASHGRGYAKALIAACVDHARAHGAHRLYLESNATLAPALGLYTAFGFQHLPPERRPVTPYARADVFMELVLGP